MKYLYLFLTVFLIDVSFSCPLDCNQVKCVQGFNPFDCPEGTLYGGNAALCGCCPGCIKLKGNNLKEFVFNLVKIIYTYVKISYIDVKISYIKSKLTCASYIILNLTVNF